MRTLIRLIAQFIARGIEYLWRRHEDSTLANRVPAAGQSVRVFNLNYALVPCAIALFLLGLTVLFLVLPKKNGNAADGWPWVAGIFAMAVAAFLLGCTRTLWVDIGSPIRVKCLFRSRTYSPQQVQSWGFEIARGRLTHTPPLSDVPFVLHFDDNRRFEVVVSPAKARHIAAAFAIKPAATDPALNQAGTL